MIAQCSSARCAIASSSQVEMDPVTRGLLDELKGLLREELITLPKWREQVAEVLREAEEQRQQSVNVSLGNMVIDESVSVSSSTSRVSVNVGASAGESLLVLVKEKSVGAAQQEIWPEDIDSWGYVRCQGCGHKFRATDDCCYWCWEEAQAENPSGVGESVTTGKDACEPEGGRVVASAKGMGGDIAYVLYDGVLEDYEKTGWEPPKNMVYDVASSYACAPTAIRPRLFDAVMQQIARLRPRPGGEAGYLEWDEDRWSFALLRVWVGRAACGWGVIQAFEMWARGWGVMGLVRAFEIWASQAALIGTLAQSPHRQQFECEW